MAKKKFNFNLKFSYDAPVTISFVLICVVLFLLNSLVFKGMLVKNLFSSPTTVAGTLPFIISQPMSYLRLLFYIFGANEPSVLITNLILIILLGPAMEERYGSVIIGIMIFVSALFAGVLNSCFCTKSLVGAVPVICMMIFLNAFISFSKKKIPLSFIVVIALFFVLQIFNGEGIVYIFISIAGGLCGSLFAFLTSSKVKTAKKSENEVEKHVRSGGFLSRAEKAAYLQELDSKSPRNKKFSSDSSDEETTVVGTLKF